MILGRLTLIISLMMAPAGWAQFGKSDIMKLAGSQVDTIIKALKLTPQQTNLIKPLLQSKLNDIAGVKKKFESSDQGEAAKKKATDSLKSIDAKYDPKITSSLNPDQLKTWKDLSKGMDDLGSAFPKM